MSWEQMATVGWIARAHGNRGQVIVNPETDFPERRFHAGAVLFVERQGAAQALTVTTVRFQQGRPVIGLAGVETMDAAEALAGRELRVPVEALAPLPAGTFYRHELVGCCVETRAGTPVGTVTAVEGTAAGSHLVVAGTEGEVLVPLAVEICTVVDPAGRRIVIDPPAGLLELNTAAGRAGE